MDCLPHNDSSYRLSLSSTDRLWF